VIETGDERLLGYASSTNGAPEDQRRQENPEA
jgi:hypothetical protein